MLKVQEMLFICPTCLPVSSPGTVHAMYAGPEIFFVTISPLDDLRQQQTVLLGMFKDAPGTTASALIEVSLLLVPLPSRYGPWKVPIH